MLVSCVDKADPDVEPEITTVTGAEDSSIGNATKVKVGDEINMRLTITDKKNNNQPLPYYYYTLTVGDAKSRNGDNADQHSGTNTRCKSPGPTCKNRTSVFMKG